MGDQIRGLCAEDDAVLVAALRLAADGPLFPDWEFQTLFGVERYTVRQVADAWPDVDVASEGVAAAVLNSLNNIVGYPHGNDEFVEQTLGVDMPFLYGLCRKAAAVIEGQTPAGDYFGRLR